MKRLFTILFASATLVQSKAQQSPAMPSSAIALAMKKLEVLGSVLYVAAHPDDENTRLLAYLSKEKLYRTGYLSITRGDGGQNLIGDEQGVELGLIRTQELLAARRIDVTDVQIALLPPSTRHTDQQSRDGNRHARSCERSSWACQGAIPSDNSRTGDSRTDDCSRHCQGTHAAACRWWCPTSIRTPGPAKQRFGSSGLPAAGRRFQPGSGPAACKNHFYP